MVDGAIDAFVRSAAIEIPRGIRINSVSPTILEESMSIYEDYRAQQARSTRTDRFTNSLAIARAV